MTNQRLDVLGNQDRGEQWSQCRAGRSAYNQLGARMVTITRRKVKIGDLPELMRRLSEEPVPPGVLDEQLRLLSEAAKVRDEMQPLPGDIKDLIRKARQGDSALLDLRQHDRLPGMIDGQYESIEEVGPAQDERRRRRVRKEAPDR
jgi:hypothetical protein